MIWIMCALAGITFGASIWTLIFIASSMVDSRNAQRERDEFRAELDAFAASR